MALRYGGDVTTRSIEPPRTGKVRASPRRTRDAGPRSPRVLLTQFSATWSTASRNLRNGFTGAHWNFLCGRLWDRSMASDAPELLVMISRDKAQRRRLRVDSFRTRLMATEREASCFLAYPSNQYATNRRVSRSEREG